MTRQRMIIVVGPAFLLPMLFDNSPPVVSSQPPQPIYAYSFDSFRVQDRKGVARTVKAHVVTAKLEGTLRLFPNRVAGNTPMTVQAFAQDLQKRYGSNNVIAVVNGGYFDSVSHMSFAKVRDRTGRYQPYDLSDTAEGQTRTLQRSALHLKYAHGKLEAYIFCVADRPVPGNMILGGGGELLPTLASPYGAPASSAPDMQHTSEVPRTAIGFNKNARHIIALVTLDRNNGVTIPELSQLMSQVRLPGGGAVDSAMAFDGGGSTTMWYKGALKCSQGRPVMTMLSLETYLP